MNPRLTSRTGKSGRLRFAAAVLGAAAIAAAGAVACGGDDDKKTAATSAPAATAAPATQVASPEKAAIETTAQKVFASWNAKDLTAFRQVVSDAGLVSIFGEDGQTVDEVLVDLQNFFGSEQIGDIKVSNVKVSGTTATADVQFAIFGSYEKNLWTLAKTGSDWKVDEEGDLVVDVPEGVKLVRLDVIEFAFGVDTSEITDGNVAFELSNVGKQAHELGIASISADANIDDLIQQIVDSPEGDVPGVEFHGFIEAEVGATSNLVFTEPLSPGRYLMLCFLPDTAEGPDGTPHAVKGMVKDFTVK